jgi:NTP pyrophosphatase (non-canonical NTP hydrolase)
MVNNMSKWFKQLQRPQVSTENLLKASEIIMTQIGKRLDQHGRGAYVSSHETLGFMQEEYKEFVYAVHSNDDDHISAELEDVAVVVEFLELQVCYRQCKIIKLLLTPNVGAHRK